MENEWIISCDVIWVLSKSVSEIIREWLWEFGDNDIKG